MSVQCRLPVPIVQRLPQDFRSRKLYLVFQEAEHPACCKGKTVLALHWTHAGQVCKKSDRLCRLCCYGVSSLTRAKEAMIPRLSPALNGGVFRLRDIAIT